jgi:cation:H+ antiporter
MWLFDTTYVLALVGVILLLAGGESLVRGTVGISRRLNISLLFVSLVTISIGTSVPELAVSLDAALMKKPDIALGNVVGSNIANILLVLGGSALIRPLVFNRKAIKFDSVVMITVSLVFFTLAWLGSLPSWIGGVFVATLATFIIISFRVKKVAPASSPERLYHEREASKCDDTSGMSHFITLTLVGIVGVVLGAWIFVDSAVIIARDLGVSEAAIGLTMVAVGTSLPELVTALIAAYRKETDIIIGNVIGSNIFNVLGVLGATLLVTEKEISSDNFSDDMIIFLLVTLAVAPFLLFFGRIRFLVGVAFLTSYVAYVGWIYQGGSL